MQIFLTIARGRRRLTSGNRLLYTISCMHCMTIRSRRVMKAWGDVGRREDGRVPRSCRLSIGGKAGACARSAEQLVCGQEVRGAGTIGPSAPGLLPCGKRMVRRDSVAQWLEISVPAVKTFGIVEPASQHRTNQDAKHVQWQVR